MQSEQKKQPQEQLKQKRRKAKRKVGRPRGHKYRPFEETRLGFYMQHETPVEYELLKQTMLYIRDRVPPVELIEAIGYASDDPFFRKQKYWKALTYYRKYKCNPAKIKKTSPAAELRYIRRNLKKYVDWSD